MCRRGGGYGEGMSSGSTTVVLVTGASSGIGLATAMAAARRGWHLVLVARDAAALERAAVRCVGAASILVVPTDVGDDDAVAACFAAAVGRHGKVDAVVHAAAVLSYGRFDRVPADVVDGVLRTNLNGSLNVARHGLRIFRAQGAGSLLLVGSVAGHVAAPAMTPYVVSKHGVRALARQLQIENRDLPDVRIRYAAPGGVDTPIYRHAANYLGVGGSPPPPVASPERVARQLLALLERRRGAEQLVAANHLIRAGFTLAPALYDALARPVFNRLLADRRRRVAPTSGNVLGPEPDERPTADG